MDIVDLTADHEHERVVLCRDAASGLRAVIAVHTTRLGPALGGTRCMPYASEEEAVEDALALSRAMTHKNAIALLPHGGGKAVIMADPVTEKNSARLDAFAAFLHSLNGEYIAACDVGTTPADMQRISRTTPHVTGRPAEHGGADDSGSLTAFGVFQAMLACAEHIWKSPDLTGRTVGVTGLGKVGRRLVGHLMEAGAKVVATDVSPQARDQVSARHRDVTLVEDDEAVVESGLDIYAPCALGGAITARRAATIDTAIICGAANRQLHAADLDLVLHERGVLYAPDFLVNAGGVIQIADELKHFDAERARAHAQRIHGTTRRVLAESDATGRTPHRVALELAERIVARGPARATDH
ncbi:Glu/Leu/Phe/Val dehydrogenase [Streptomyces sp. NPDC050085]|uniref:Glu/Leu/Phe/Val dehydrogenase n=1 Tax=Streptomyces sp. NPDC050085 TaxID=3365600 RepID=UPI00379424CD